MLTREKPECGVFSGNDGSTLKCRVQRQKRKLAREIRRSQPQLMLRAWISCRWETLNGSDRKKIECVCTLIICTFYMLLQMCVHTCVCIFIYGDLYGNQYITGKAGRPVYYLAPVLGVQE